jgi:predicted RNase H-like HicB family nuclease
MKFAIALEKDDPARADIITPVYGVTIPDLPGCHSWGDTVEQALENSKEAIFEHVQILHQFDEQFSLKQQPIAKHRLNPEFAKAEWHEVEVDLSQFGR